MCVCVCLCLCFPFYLNEGPVPLSMQHTWVNSIPFLSVMHSAIYSVHTDILISVLNVDSVANIVYNFLSAKQV